MIDPNTATLARLAHLLPMRSKALAAALGTSASRLSEWLTIAAGGALKGRRSGNYPPTDAQVAIVRELLERHHEAVAAELGWRIDTLR